MQGSDRQSAHFPPEVVHFHTLLISLKKLRIRLRFPNQLKGKVMKNKPTEKVEISEADAQVVDLGRVQDLTGGTGSGQFEDGSKTSSNRKDKYGGAGER